MKKVEINNKLSLIPDKWGELSKEQLLKWCEVSLRPVNQPHKRILLLSYFTGLSVKQLNELPKETLPEQAVIFDYLFKESKLTKNHFPELEGMKGPEDGLVNFTFEQFLGHAEPYRFSISSGNHEHVNELIGVMYNFNGPEENIKKIEGLNQELKLACYLFYLGCSNFIKTRFKSAFPEGEKKTKQDGLEFVRLINAMNLGDVSKNEKIKNTNLYEALTFIVSNIEKNGPK